jgi:uncharacterized membrane protein
VFGRGKKKPKTKADDEREARQLGRLQTLIDVVFALLIVRILVLMPNPTGITWTGRKDLLDFLAAHSGRFEVILVGTVFILIYWVQNNKTFGNLRRTDGTHAALSIVQVVLLLLYFYFVRMGVEFKGDIASLFFQSVFLALAGFTAVAAWSYALKDRRLLSESITGLEARELRFSIMSEPITALFTIPFAWLGAGWWTLAWLANILISRLLKRRLPKEGAA